MNPLPHQMENAKRMMLGLAERGSSADTSDTGVGKTMTAGLVAGVFWRQSKKRTLVICPLSVIEQWREALHGDVGLPPEAFDVVNYDKIRKDPKRMRAYHLIVFDEAHRVTGHRTLQSKLPIAARKYGKHVLLLSATLFQSPLKMRSIGYVLGMHGLHDFTKWMRRHGCVEGDWGWEYHPTQENVDRLSRALYSGTTPRAVRTARSDVAELFPSERVDWRLLDVGFDGAKKSWLAAYAEIFGETPQGVPPLRYLSELVETGIRDGYEPNLDRLLPAIVAARTVSERVKTPAMIETAQDLIAQGNSVVLFFNFLENGRKAADALTVPFLCGATDRGDRAKQQKRFLNDNLPAIVCQTAVGGVGLNLNDRIGDRPRVSLISPDFSVVNFTQALGRIMRVATKTPVWQIACFAKGTIEERVRNVLVRKARTLESIQQRDITEDALGVTAILDKFGSANVGPSAKKHKQNKT